MTEKERLRDVFHGCIIGGALGDALGYPVEFQSYDSIVSHYGERGIQDLVIRHKGFAEFSDDTQMTLFTMDGLRQGILRAEYKGVSAKPEWYISLAYQDWLATQEGTRETHNSFTELFRQEKGLDEWRAPGNTCMSALAAQNVGSPNPPYSNEIYSMEHPGNQSKGCGGVMRVAPIGLMLRPGHWISKDGPAHTAGQAAAITHGNPLGYLPAAYLAELVNRLTYRKDVGDSEEGSVDLMVSMQKALDVIDETFAGTPSLDYFDEIVEKAWRLAEETNEKELEGLLEAQKRVEIMNMDVRNIHAIGGGWVGEEALAIALYCAARYPYDFHQALRIAVNHSGDSDSTGAITGNILGAFLGMKEIEAQC